MTESTAAPRTPNLLTIGVLAIALAAVFLVGFQVRDDDPAPAAAVAGPADTQPTGVITQGVGTTEATPDQLTFSATVTNRRDTNAGALRATNHDVRAVIINLKKNGVADKDITTATLSIKPRYEGRGASRRVVGYTATQRVRVLVRVLDKAGETLGGVSTAAGNAVEIGDLRLSLSDEDAVIARARAAAVEKSKAAAAALAEAAGRQVSELVYVEELAPDPYRFDNGFAGLSAAYASKALNETAGRLDSVPIKPGQQKFSVSVKVRWSLA